MQKNAILLGGPKHGQLVKDWAVFGPTYQCATPDRPVKHRTLRDIFNDPEPSTFTLHVYKWEYRGRTIFGVYQKYKS